MVNPGDYVASDEEIDIEMFDSDVELSKATGVSQNDVAAVSSKQSDSDSDFVSTGKAKRGSNGAAATTKRGRGRGKGRGASSGTTRATKKAAAGTEVVLDESGNPIETPKAKRGRPRKLPVVYEDADGNPVAEKPKATRGRKKAVPLASNLSDAAEDEFDILDDDDDGDFGGKTKAKAKPRKAAGTGKGKARQMTFDDIQIPTKEPIFDPDQIAELARQYPDPYWSELEALQNGLSSAGDNSAEPRRIDFIDDEHPLELISTNMTDQMALTGMALSPDGTMLATFGSSGSVRVWDTDTFECLTTLRDASEANIDEFFVGQFTPNSEYIVVGGKLKDRKRWSEADEDNHILPCPLKVFNVLTGQVVARLDGHSEEILCVKSVVYKGENYFVTTSQDGYIRRWHMDSNWIVLLGTDEVEDGVTCMAFTVSFVPNTGNRFFVAATDDHVTLMDLERCKIVQRFDPIYSSYCDCGKFIELVEEPEFQARKPVKLDDDGDGDAESMVPEPAEASSSALPAPTGPYAYFVTRGVELLDAEDNTVSSRPNTCTLHRLVYPTDTDGKFMLQEVRRYHHDEYLSNSWLIRIASNGRYLLAPTLNGQVFVFSLAGGQVTGILRDHETIEVRDCKFHPTKNLVFTCSDDGSVKVYRGGRRKKREAEDVEMEAAEDTAVSGSSEVADGSPLASLKKRVESLAVGDGACAADEAVVVSDERVSADDNGAHSQVS
ncbi:hypothetical protein GGI15_003198 [Coemansia interrupta]|uniref:Uncharacterized protein n=1 Tax=Coemansia interrupta TaxID=1126814 RepID=A0A9W8LJH1_9FUNG|nr:hypothetical protein GGI15_003198 [Coemansia interrupta]